MENQDEMIRIGEKTQPLSIEVISSDVARFRSYLFGEFKKATMNTFVFRTRKQFNSALQIMERKGITWVTINPGN